MTNHPKTVFLYLHDDHYYMIMNLTGFLGSPYVCQFCYKSYTTAETIDVSKPAMSVLTPNVTGSLKEPYIAPIVCVTVNRAIASKCIKRTPLPVKNPPPVILSNTANYAAGVTTLKRVTRKQNTYVPRTNASIVENV